MRFSLIIYVATLQHLFWGVTLLYSSSPLSVIAIQALYGLMPSRHGLALVILSSSLLGMLALLDLRRFPIWRGVLLVPQQALLIMAALGAMFHIIAGQGVTGHGMDRALLIAQQSPLVLIAVFHSFAIAHPALGPWWDRWTRQEQVWRLIPSDCAGALKDPT